MQVARSSARNCGRQPRTTWLGERTSKVEVCDVRWWNHSSVDFNSEAVVDPGLLQETSFCSKTFTPPPCNRSSLVVEGGSVFFLPLPWLGLCRIPSNVSGRCFQTQNHNLPRIIVFQNRMKKRWKKLPIKNSPCKKPRRLQMLVPCLPLTFP